MPHLSAVSLLKGGIHTYVFISNLFTMIGPDHDVFSTLISPTIRSSVPLFVSSHYKFAQSLDNPRMALQSRFVVTNVAINKAGKPVHHESFAVWVTDTKLDRKHYFIIEQQPSALSKSSRFDCFTSFPASGMVLKSIENAFKNMRSMSTHAALALFNSMSTGDTELIPLIPSQPDFDMTESLNSSPSSTPFIDTMTLTLAMVVVATLRSGSKSVKPQSLAEDTISGCPLDPLRRDETIQKFKAVELSLFDVAFLVKVVHDPSTACSTTSVTCSPASCSMLWSSYTPCRILLIIPIIRLLQPHLDPFQFPLQRPALPAMPTYCSCLHQISPAIGQAF